MKRDSAVFSSRCCERFEEHHYETVRILRWAPGSSFIGKGSILLAFEMGVPN
jgi:hypothetical protein